MGRFKKLVESKEAMEKFIVDYRIPSNVGLRYCEEGEWHFMRQRGEVVIPMSLHRRWYENPYGVGDERLP